MSVVHLPRPGAARLSSLSGARGLLAAYVEIYRRSKSAAAKAELSRCDLAKVAASIKQDMCQ